MTFDSIIIGGGLAGLTCALALAKAGQRTALVTAGQSTLHFHSGSIDLLGYDEQGRTVLHPLDAIPALGASHPYHKVADVGALAEEAAGLLASAGLPMDGTAARNHFRLTPMGVGKPTWLTLQGLVQSTEEQTLPWREVTFANIRGFLDIPTEFLVDNIRRMGTDVEVKHFTTPELEQARRSPSEMRATNVAKVLADETSLRRVVEAIDALGADGEVVLLPAVLGMADAQTESSLRQLVERPVRFVATMPPSVPGVRLQTRLRQTYQQLGGMYCASDTVTGGCFEAGRLRYVTTGNMPDERLYADHFVLATGSFQSRGLMSNYHGVFEPVFGLDVDAAGDRRAWTAEYVYDAQPYMRFGVRTDERLLTCRGGARIDNLYAAGSVLSGHDALKLADGSGVDMLTALQVAHNILEK